MSAKSVLVVDDHPIVREGIAQLLASQPDLRVSGNAVDIASARKAARECPADVALVDLSLGCESGLDLIPLLMEDAPHMPILALSMHDEALYAKRALQAGARGYIMKHEGTEVLLQAIRVVVAGQIYVSSRINEVFLRALSEGRQPEAEVQRGILGELSNRELQVYRLVGQGRSTKEIAQDLYLSAKTVETHRAHIKQKLGVETTAALVAHAAEWLYRSSHVVDPPRDHD